MGVKKAGLPDSVTEKKLLKTENIRSVVQKVKNLLKANLWFFVPTLIFVVVAVGLLVIYPKPELHILSNKANSPFFDIFFKYTTNLGNGAMIAILFIILLFVKYRVAFAFLAGSLATSLFINIIKKFVFHEVYRPSKYFELYESYRLHFIEGVKLYSLQSFPSGHSGTAFNVFLTLALLSKNNGLKLVFFVMALLAAYSRVYLSQHFLIDITAGSVTGVLFIILFWIWFDKFNYRWLDQSILTRQK